MDETEPSSQTHEERDVRLRPIIVAGVSLALLAGLTLLAMWQLFDYFDARRARVDVLPPLFEARQLPPEPRLQVSPQQAMREMRAAEMAHLHSYGWVDREAGIVRIPIERAIELLAERGLPNDRGAMMEERGSPRQKIDETGAKTEGGGR